MPIQTQIPKGWRLVRLGDVAHIRNNLALAGEDGRTAYVALEHILSGGRLTSHGKSADSVSTKTRFQQGDTLYGKLRPNLRKVIRAEFDGVCSTEILAIFAKGKWDGRFLSHLIRGDLLHGHAMQGITGTKMPRTSWGHLKTFEFLSPPLPEQRAIAAVLDSIDGAIERTEAVIAATGQLRDSLLHELLTRGVPGWHTEWKEAPGLGTIPAGWEVVRLGEGVIHVGSGVTPKGGKSAYTSSGITFLRSQNVHFDGLRLEDVVYIPSEIDNLMRRSRVQPEDVLLNITGASIGRCTIAPLDLGPANVNQHVCIIRTTEGFNSHFVWKWLSTPRSQREIDDIQTGQSRQGLNYQQVRQLTVARPPRAEQDSIVEIQSGVDATLAEAKRERDGLQLLKESTADALLTGRVRVGV